MRFLAFDLEVATAPPDFMNWRAHRPLGISCAATMDETRQHRVWFGRKPDGTPAPRMSQSEAAGLLVFLASQQQADRIVVSWNGANFDLDVLGEESGNRPLAADIARDHVDLMVVVGCLRGHWLSLGKAARAVQSSKGAAGITSGADPPALWEKGEYDRVLSYVTQDVRAVADIIAGVFRERGLTWTTDDGAKAWFTLPPAVQALEDMTVAKALEWPPPITSAAHHQSFDRNACLAWTRD